mgnify:CR=1 FL=1|jgi:short subunit dehydrogenase-like uncharacterized protein
MKKDREIGVVVYGASRFTERLITEYPALMLGDDIRMAFSPLGPQ